MPTIRMLSVHINKLDPDRTHPWTHLWTHPQIMFDVDPDGLEEVSLLSSSFVLEDALLWIFLEDGRYNSISARSFTTSVALRAASLLFLSLFHRRLAVFRSLHIFRCCLLFSFWHCLLYRLCSNAVLLQLKQHNFHIDIVECLVQTM